MLNKTLLLVPGPTPVVDETAVALAIFDDYTVFCPE